MNKIIKWFIFILSIPAQLFIFPISVIFIYVVYKDNDFDWYFDIFCTTLAMFSLVILWLSFLFRIFGVN